MCSTSLENSVHNREDELLEIKFGDTSLDWV